MFGALFEEDGAGGSGSGTGRSTSHVPGPRGATGFCGLDNLGTTCYLNSLLQTMYLTPGFRDALFSIPPTDLGYLSVDGAKAASARTIPFELQTLFAGMARMDQASVSTEELTKSFGWSAGDAVVQHDVQELNRIFFDAIEKSLAGTPHAGFIPRLYGGSLVNLIKCLKCGTVRRRDEQFLDITVPIAGLPDLPTGLASFTTMELLNGANQYRCDTCSGLVDAEKGIRLLNLPPILALSLNRFRYDWSRDTRVKETGAFPFPTTLDMTPYCEHPAGPMQYELYSVVIHGGAAHGGHYHAYIRDIYGEGHWSKSEMASAGGQKLEREPKEPAGGKGKGKGAGANKENEQRKRIPDDPIPVLVRIVLELSQDRPKPDISDVSQKLVEKIGQSWNLAYKLTLGPLGKFLAARKDLFDVVNEKFVSLTEAALIATVEKVASEVEQASAGPAAAAGDEEAELQAALAMSMDPEGSGVPDPGHCWFDFNDSRVSCIPAAAIEKQFGGKESAYMLFYANSAMLRTQRRPVLPGAWAARIDFNNMMLAEARRAADLAAHSLELHLHLAPRYKLGTVLAPNHAEPVVPFTIDERVSTSTLAPMLRERFPELGSATDPLPLHVATVLRDGLLVLQSELKQDSDVSTLLADGFRPQMHILVGTLVDKDGAGPRVGGDVLPVKVTDGRSESAVEKTVFAYADTSLSWLRNDIAAAFACEPEAFALVRADRKQWTSVAALAAFAPSKDPMGVGALGLVANSHLMLITLTPAEPAATTDGGSTAKDASSATATPGGSPTKGESRAVGPSEEVLRKLKDSVTVNVGYHNGKKLPTAIQLTLDSSRTIAEWRLSVAGALGCDAAGMRLKVQRQSDWELLVPEDMTGKAAHIDTGTVLGLETGSLPGPAELFLFVRIAAKKDTPVMEIILSSDMPIFEAVATLVAGATLPEGAYHLARANAMTGDADKVYSEQTQTLSAVGLVHNQRLLLQAGRVIPKGSTRVGLFLDVHELTDTMRELMAPHIKFPERRNPDDIVARMGELTMDALVQLEDLELPLSATIEALKAVVLAIPSVAAVCGDPAALRLRDMDGLRMTRLLTDPTRMLKQLKFPASGKHLALTILPHPDAVDPSTLFLNVCRRYPDGRTCSRTRQIQFNGGNAPTLEQLTNVLSVEFGVAPEELVLAKYNKSARDWTVFDSAAGKKARKGRKMPAAGSLREVPYALKDGDLLAVKVRSDDPKGADDFVLPTQREPAAPKTTVKKEPRPEPRLAIHVPSFPDE